MGKQTRLTGQDIFPIIKKTIDMHVNVDFIFIGVVIIVCRLFVQHISKVLIIISNVASQRKGSGLKYADPPRSVQRSGRGRVSFPFQQNLDVMGLLLDILTRGAALHLSLFNQMSELYKCLTKPSFQGFFSCVGADNRCKKPLNRV